jgi:hypothetical protein
LPGFFYCGQKKLSVAQAAATSPGSASFSVCARRSKVSGNGARLRHTRAMVRPGGGDLKGRISTDF